MQTRGVTPKSSQNTNPNVRLSEEALEEILQKEEEKFFEINQRERKTSIALKRTENDNLAL